MTTRNLVSVMMSNTY